MASKITLHNQIELPPIDEFRLSNILSKVVHAEQKSLSNSILNVKNHFQADLRSELRHSLSREQRIQYKNIAVEKKAALVRKKIKCRKKRWAKLGANATADLPNAAISFGASTEKTDNLPSEVASLHEIAASISEGVLTLASRLSALDVCLGGTGLPLQEKYPMIHQMLSKRDDSETKASHLQPIGNSGEIGNEESEMNTFMEQNQSIREANFWKDNERKRSNSEHLTMANGQESDSDEINSEIFENLINEYNRKSRLKIERRLSGIESASMNSGVETASINSGMESAAKDSRVESASIEVESGISTAAKRPRNPLRLLSACGSIRSLETSVSDRLENRFLPAKSMATVGESPELTLHKKLRINALPLPSKRDQTCKCIKQDGAKARLNERVNERVNESVKSVNESVKSVNESVKSVNESVNDSVNEKIMVDDAESKQSKDRNSSKESPARNSLSKFLSNYDSQFADVSTASASFDMDFDSSGINSDSDSAPSMQSSDSSELFMGNIGDTNEYYDSLRRVMRKHSQKRKSSRSTMKEASPNPKHQPSHRTLQPKQSILKFQRRKPCDQNDFKNDQDIVNDESVKFDCVKFDCVKTDMNFDFANVDSVKQQVEIQDTFSKSQYTVSPQASFVMENSAAGEILRHANPETEPKPSEPEAISRLRNLLL